MRARFRHASCRSQHLFFPMGTGKLVLEEAEQGGKVSFLRGQNGQIRLPYSAPGGAPSLTTRLSFISKVYHLRVALLRTDYPRKLEYHYNSFAKRIAVINSNANAGENGVNHSYARQLDLSIVALVSEGSMKRRLALLRLKGSPNSWAWDTDFCMQVFQDIATYRGRLCALNSLRRVVLVESLDSLEITRLSPCWPQVCEVSNKYLFEDGGNLYVANFSNMRIVMYRLNLCLQIWVTVQASLDSLSFLLLLDKYECFNDNNLARICAHI